MLDESHSDSRQIQKERNLKQLRFRKVMDQNDINEVQASLKELLNKIEESFNQCHPEFQTDLQKIKYH